MDKAQNDAVIGRHYKGATIAWGGGAMYDFDNPNPEVATLEDVAYALGGTVRWRGQTRHGGGRCYYWVAQHCVIGAEEMVAAGHGHRNALAFLWHEADEIVLPDFPGPIKDSVPGFREVATRQGDAFLRHWKIPDIDPALSKAWDLRMLITEKRDIMTGHQHDRFHSSSRVEVNETDYPPFERQIVPMATPEETAERWLRTHHWLATMAANQ